MCSRYMNGAATNPDAHVVAYAAAQLKKGLDIAKKLGAENYGIVVALNRSGRVHYVSEKWYTIPPPPLAPGCTDKIL